MSHAHRSLHRTSPSPSQSMSLSHSPNLSGQPSFVYPGAAPRSSRQGGWRRSARPSSASQLYSRHSARKESGSLGNGNGGMQSNYSPSPPQASTVLHAGSGDGGGMMGTSTPGMRASRYSQVPDSARQQQRTPDQAKDKPKNAASASASVAPRQQMKEKQEAAEAAEASAAAPVAEEWETIRHPQTILARTSYEDMYTACFLTTLQEETLENELACAFRDSSEKISSSFNRVRNEGLREALERVRSLAICAAVEAQQSQVAAATVAAATANGGVPVPPPPEDAFLSPFNALRANMTAGAATAPAEKDDHTNTNESARRAVPYQSESWSRAQRALRSSDLTSAVFRRVLVPRNDVRASMNMGAPVNVGLTTEEALAWSTRHKQVRLSPLEKLRQQSRDQHARNSNHDSAKAPGVASKDGLRAGEYGEGGGKRTVTPYGQHVTVPTKTIYDMMTEVTYEEQEMALRFLQGLCLTMNYQRRCIAEGCLFHYAAEVFQCLLQHVEAVFAQRRRLRLTAASNNTSNHTNYSHLAIAGEGSGSPLRGVGASASSTFTAMHGPLGTSASPLASANAPGASLYLATPITLGSGTFTGKTVARELGEDARCSVPGSPILLPSALRSAGGGDPYPTYPLDSSPVEVDEEQVMVVVALIDAIEAACHYNPPCLTRLVQTGSVTAMLNLVYSPCVPESIRAALLDTISVLMQEVAPFRRAVAVGPPQRDGDGNAVSAAAGGGGAVNVNAAHEGGDLLAVMVEQAITGSFHSPGADSNGDAPPYMMDRASASKFDSAVREWFSRHGLSHVVTGVMELRTVKGWWRLWGEQQQQNSHHHFPHPHAGGGAGGGGGGAGGGSTGGGVSAIAQVSIETTRARQRATQQRAANISALLQAIDGKRADLRKP